MKTINFKKALSASIAIIILFVNHSCKKPTDDLQLIYNTDVTEATASFQFYNAATGELMGAATDFEVVEVSIEGRDKNLVIDNAGSDNFKVVKGCITVGIKKGSHVSEDNPVKFSIVAHADGYVSTSIAVDIRAAGTQHQEVRMVEIDNTPKGVAAVVDHEVQADNSGVTQATVVVSSPTMNSDFEATKASVTIPQGTQLLDANYNPVTGPITTTLVYFNNQDDAALQSFPGGFAVTTDEFGDIVFKTAGFLALEMKNQSGKEVKHFSTPIQMNVEIPAATTNTDQQPITEGMTVPIWSYNPETAKWIQESIPTIALNGSTGKYEVNFEMIHLSYWNLDWHYSGSCANGAKITVQSNYSNGHFGTFELRYPNGQLCRQNSFSIDNGYTFQFLNAFPNQPMQAVAYDANVSCGGSKVQIGSVSIASLCSGVYTLVVNKPPSLEKPIVSLQVKAKCANRPGQIIKPSTTIYAMDESSGCWNYIYLGEMVNGVISTSKLEQGKTYRFYAYIGGYFLQSPETYKIDQTSYVYDQTLPASLCSLF